MDVNQDLNRSSKAADEKYCSSCGSVIKTLAEICPKCGVRQSQAPRLNKTALILLALFFGGVGGHKFYLGKIVQGIFYALFFWTLIPSMIALVELIIYALTPEETLNAKYPKSLGNSIGIVNVILACAFGGTIVLGMLAALAIPRFMGATEKAKISEWRPVLKQIAVLEESYRIDHGVYTSNLDSIGFTAPSGFPLRFEYSVQAFDSTNFKARAKLVTKIGKAESGDEVVVDKDFNISATGGIQSYIRK